MTDATDRFGKARLAAIVESSDDAILGMDLGGIVTSWNGAAERLFGWSPSEVIGRHISLIAPDEARREEMANILARIRGGDRVRHHETERRRKDGTLVPISLTVSPIVGDDGGVVGASKIARDISERRLDEDRTRVLLRELDHRAKNVLAVAQAMMRLTNADRIEDFKAALEGRIRTLARIHTLVADNQWDGAELGLLVRSGAEIFHDHRGNIHANGPVVWLSPEAAQVMGIVLHELTTNAARHGSLTATDGSVAIDWRLDDEGHAVLAWGERNGPRVATPTRRGFGTQVIAQSVADQLGGTSDLRWLENGLECEFTLPSSHIRKPPRGAGPVH